MPAPANSVAVAIDGALSPALTGPIVHIPVGDRVLNRALYLSDGTDIQAYASDGTTTLATKLRAWNAVGLYLKKRYTPAAAPYVYATGVDVLTTASGAKRIVVGVGTDLLSPPVSGQVVVFDPDTGDEVATWASPGDDFVMNVRAVPQASGGDRLAVNTRLIDCTSYLLEPDLTTVVGSYDFSTTYVRALHSASVSGSNRVVIGGPGGRIILLDNDYAPVWEKIGTTALCYPSCNDSTRNNTIQNVLIDDADGTFAVYHVYGDKIRRASITDGSQVWLSAAISGLMCFGVTTGRLGASNRRVVGVHGGDSSQIGMVSVYESADGTLVWRKPLRTQAWNVCCLDIDGDGYDEIVVTGGQHDVADPPEIGVGVVWVLDRDGNELQCFDVPGAIKMARVVDFGDGPEILCTANDGSVLRLAPTAGAGSVRVTLPNISAGGSTTIYLAPTGSSAIPTASEGIATTTTAGTDGTLPAHFTDHSAAGWAIQDDWLRSPDTGDAGGLRACGIAGTSRIDLEATFEARFIANGTNVAADYYVYAFYRASSFSGSFPKAYRLAIGLKGNLTLDRVPSGSGTQTYRLYDDGAGGAGVWAGCSLNDVLKVHVVASANWHALAIGVDGGPPKLVYLLRDSTDNSGGLGRIETTGTFALANNRGQAEFRSLTYNGYADSSYTYMGVANGQGQIGSALDGPFPAAFLEQLEPDPEPTDGRLGFVPMIARMSGGR